MSDTYRMSDDLPPRKRAALPPEVADEPDEPEPWTAKPPKLELVRLAGVALIVVGLGVVVAFAKVGVDVKSKKVFAGLAAGGPVAVVLGVGLVAFPLPLPYLLRAKDFKEPGVKEELLRDLPFVWKVWAGLTVLTLLLALAGAFFLVAPGRR